MSKKKVMDEISKVYEENQDEILQKENVIGIGVGYKYVDGKKTEEPCITIFVSQKLMETQLREKDIVPKEISEYKTDVVEIGEIFAGELLTKVKQDDNKSAALNHRMRPVRGGLSVGHYKITTGTIATAVYDADSYPGNPGKYYILSNNHVLANSNDAKVGDVILQPGPYDGGQDPDDVIARLSRYIPIKFSTENNNPLNYADAAIAEGNFFDIDRQIYWIGNIRGSREEIEIGEIVQKTGRTTHYTTGEVISVNATVDVSYGSAGVARFARQIVTSNMSAGGDSGSLVCDLDGNAVGLLFAGSSKATIINNISYVTRLLNIRLHP
ncbi:MAG: serine protease, partial [Halanaerobiales bacterium]